MLNKLISTAPPGELDAVVEDLNCIVDDRSGVAAAVDDFVNEGVVVEGLIASKWNRHDNKYADHVTNKLFNVEGTRAIDFEDFQGEADPVLVEGLQQYGETHFPSSYAFTIVPGNTIHVVIIGSRNNLGNYYTGYWKSHYEIKESHITGTVVVDIHYYEDGNVRMSYQEVVSGTVDNGMVVNAIEEIENKVTLSLVDRFTALNQHSFKNLRRLLPVTRSKINWGSAIGNYRLGSDVVNSK
ncbi:F-actin-capping protein subunit alpha [Diutina catenulata]